jgi:hypothetical protein
MHIQYVSQSYLVLFAFATILGRVKIVMMNCISPINDDEIRLAWSMQNIIVRQLIVCEALQV